MLFDVKLLNVILIFGSADVKFLIERASERDWSRCWLKTGLPTLISVRRLPGLKFLQSSCFSTTVGADWLPNMRETESICCQQQTVTNWVINWSYKTKHNFRLAVWRSLFTRWAAVNRLLRRSQLQRRRTMEELRWRTEDKLDGKVQDRVKWLWLREVVRLFRNKNSFRCFESRAGGCIAYTRCIARFSICDY